MKRISSLNDLLIEELSGLLNVENQLVEALPQMAQICHLSSLRLVFDDHLEITKQHIYRLQHIFSRLQESPQIVPCKAMKILIQETEDVVRNKDNGPDRDTALINLAQRMEQYEIAAYGIAREHTLDLGHTGIVKLLDDTINEERAMNLHLSEVAQGMINSQAIDPQGKKNGTLVV